VRGLRRLLLLAAVVLGGGYLYTRFWMGPGPEELARLRRENADLRARVESRLRGRGGVAGAPEGTVLIGIPARAAATLAAETTAGLFREVGLALRDVKVRKEDEVQASLLGRRTLGHFALTLVLREVRARLRPGKPRLTFGQDRIGVALPVTIAEGSGHGRLHLEWDGRGMAGAICGDLETTLDVAGAVVPGRHTLEGAFLLSAEGATVVARPMFGEVKVRVPIEPSRETWKAVHALIDGRSALCRSALKAAHLEDKLRSALEKGVVVTIPPNALAREVRLPAVLERPLDLPERSMHLDIRPSGLTVAPGRLWYGATVEVTKRPLDRIEAGSESN
jgi:hypothetical protein